MVRLRSYGQMPEDAAWQQHHAARKRWELEQERVSDSVLEKYLEDIHFEDIDSYLQKECRRSGSVVDADHPITKESFFILPSVQETESDLLSDAPRDDIATHRAASRLIELNPDRLRTTARELGILLNTWLLFVVCHEAVHDYSFTRVRGEREFHEIATVTNILKELFLFWKAPPERSMQVISGYKKTESRYGGKSDDNIQGGRMTTVKILEILDEGVTDHVAFEMMENYLRLHPGALPREEFEHLRTVFRNPKQKMGHARAMALVDELIDGLHQESRLDRTVVWGAIKRGKFGADNVHDPETMALLKAAMPEPLMRKLLRHNG
ncbi:hypothetical protein HZA86_01005 [Candidatus Uhrbacteria bacterium]|nr:hypothetical protein [Candidatus Uhrbacteria bacterium]